MTEKTLRRLAAIVSADVAGYSRLMGRDEAGTLRRLNAHRSEHIDPLIAKHGGRIVKTTGDGLLLEFPSVVAASECVVAVQEGMATRNSGIGDDDAICFRIGVHLGDVIVESDDIFGDGVNISARLQEICDTGCVTISSNAHDSVEGRIEAEFVDGGDRELKNIERSVRVWQWAPSAFDAEVPTVINAPLPLPDKPSIAVLPFDNMSGDPEQEFFADGMTEDIITLLSSVPDLFVIARNSTFAYKGQSPDVRKVAADLGVRYVLEGSVRKAGNRIRVTAQFIDAESGNHIWADRYDRVLDDIFAVQDEVTQGIAGALQSRLLMAEASFLSRKPPGALDAWGNVVRAKTLLQNYRRQDIDEAEPFAKRSTNLDPNYAIGHAVSAYILAWRSYNGWTDDFKTTASESLRHGEQALHHGPNDPTVLADVGFACWWLGRFRQARPLLQRAIELNPNAALANAMHGYATAAFGETEKGIEFCELAFRLSPRDPIEYMFWWLLAASRQFHRDYEGAKEAAERSINLNSTMISAQLVLAGACVRLNDIGRAKAVLEQVRQSSDTAIPFIFRAGSEGTLWHEYTNPIREVYDGPLPEQQGNQ
ncbi:MAG: adenylate/guanylate cyclase domain-containing protein [Rhodospirillaceae bacterium]|jgi:adenylate cyclase|nr:adenylate/guanylate cyclase domain-containing protein [Rhodospirillaceae bacterium]MBT4687180.1 adenylate/guanylate cyclase domain-containing protein [Rhodospirillaceae bacterium]MBT7667926.1 adenylate/guanylate cyclase domain-containing protein [Rhodospirillaceae bacterium]